MTKKDELTEFLLYTAPNGDVKVEIVFHNETVWLTQKRIAELFGVDISTINEHLKNLYKTEELEENSTIGNFPIVQKEGVRKVKRGVIIRGGHHTYFYEEIISYDVPVIKEDWKC